MIAWTLRAVLVAVLALTLGLMALAWQAQRMGILAWLLMLPVGLIGVFALQGVWLHARNRADAAPRATVAQVIASLWHELRISVPLFLWHMPLAGPEPQVHLDAARHRGRTPLLLVHGYFCNAAFWRDWMPRLRHADTPYMAITLEPAYGSIDDMAPVVDAALARLVQTTGCAAVIVGHSMGGLATRAWWRRSDAVRDRWVHRVITIGTPHQGTASASLAHTPNGRQMREANPWLQALSADEPAGRAARATCFYSHCDNIVFPASLATWPGADNRHVPAAAHIALIEEPVCQAEVQRWLDVPPIRLADLLQPGPLLQPSAAAEPAHRSA
jgi:triacylglycerol lipase